MNNDCLEQAILLRDALAAANVRIVLAESCTAGRVAATLGAIPGISQWLCGSFVIYRNDSKSQWLGIPNELLEDPQAGPVSAMVTRLLAQAAAQRTPEARYAIAVTGDVGPGASDATDGVCFCAVYDRETQHCHQSQLTLNCPAPKSNLEIESRVRRLNEATQYVLDFALQSISQQSAVRST